MKKTLLLLTLLLAASSLGWAGACASGTLASYLSAGFSCTETIGPDTLTFSGFKLTAGTSAGVNVTALASGFAFGPFSVGPGNVVDFSLVYNVSGDLDSIMIDLQKPMITGNGTGLGAVVGTEHIAMGSTFLGSLLVYDNAKQGLKSSAFLELGELAGPFTIGKDLTMSGKIGNKSTASVGGLLNEFNTPEPGSMLLFGSGLLAVAGYVRRRQRRES